MNMLPQEFKIRFAEQRDLSVICAIFRSVYGDEDPMPEHLKSGSKTKNITFYLLELRGHCVSNLLPSAAVQHTRKMYSSNLL